MPFKSPRHQIAKSPNRGLGTTGAVNASSAGERGMIRAVRSVHQGGSAVMRVTQRSAFVLVHALFAGWVIVGVAHGVDQAGSAAPAPAAQTAATYRAAMEQADLAIQKENKDHS